MNETEGMLERSAPVFRCTVCSTYQWGPSCACGIDTARQCTATDRGAEQWRGLINQIGATERERDSHGETIVQLAADLDRVSDDLELHRVAYKAANEELQDIYATIRPIQAEGNVKAVDVYRSLLDANSTLSVQLNAAVRAREILDEERTTTGVKAVDLTAKNHALREEREHIKSIVWTLNNALTTYHDFTSELLEAHRLASQVPGLYADDWPPAQASPLEDVLRAGALNRRQEPEIDIDVKFDDRPSREVVREMLDASPAIVGKSDVTAAEDVARRLRKRHPSMAVSVVPLSGDEVPSL